MLREEEQHIEETSSENSEDEEATPVTTKPTLTTKAKSTRVGPSKDGAAAAGSQGPTETKLPSLTNKSNSVAGKIDAKPIESTRAR